MVVDVVVEVDVDVGEDVALVVGTAGAGAVAGAGGGTGNGAGKDGGDDGVGAASVHRFPKFPFPCVTWFVIALQVPLSTQTPLNKNRPFLHSWHSPAVCAEEAPPMVYAQVWQFAPHLQRALFPSSDRPMPLI